MTDGILLLLAALAASAVWGGLARRRDGRFRTEAAQAAPRLSAADLGGPLDRAATFVLVTAPTCATCPQVRRVLHAVAAERSDVAVREIDAAERMDLVRELGILRTPTVLLLDASGTVRRRTSGPLRAEQARATLADLLPLPSRS